MKHGKKYEAALKLIDKTKAYTIEEACELIKSTSTTKFDSSVGIAFKLNINTKKADQQVRGTVVLPNGTGKSVRVLALTNKAEDAKAAGADFAGGKELLEKIVTEKWFDFDVICATPDMMGEIGKAGRILGPKGLMPNPKTGTVGMDIKKMVTELKAGKVEYRADRDGNVNLAVGKVSFDTEKLTENVKTIVAQILKVRPSVVKGTYVLSCFLCTTMGPSIKLNIL
ncbi:MAG: 50S ribosomal protein L1 [Mollicutes bacterium]|nr:50S ribosomal protein L1 [Mollicutes bacterium]MDY4979970.1 50S ribosomal protein L1 [Candidatus Onthovivens sp.]